MANPKHISIRMDRQTGELWLTEEKYAQPVKRLKMITSDVILALAAEIIAVEDTRSACRDVKFSDGAHIRILVQDLTKGDPEQDLNELRELAKAVISNWDNLGSGTDLAGAVRELACFLNQKENEHELVNLSTSQCDSSG